MAEQTIDLNSDRFLSKLYWACRRGMLELDVLLGNYLREVYPNNDTEQKKRFIALLQHPDPSLFAWLMGHEIPEDVDVLTIVEAIRSHAQSRF